MRPEKLKTRLFLDGGDPEETKVMQEKLGFIDGQTTNPTLIAKNPVAMQRMNDGKKFTEEEILGFYKEVVQGLSALLPKGSVSIEVYADQTTSADDMFSQGKAMFGWIPNAHIKYPTTSAGLDAANRSISEGMRVNMTLCFTQEQAAAVYAATNGAKKGDVFISPFIGRLDDRGENGMDLVKNIIAMYKEGDGHVETLAASVRTYEHLLASLAYGADIITAPLKVYLEWAENGMTIPEPDYSYNAEELKSLQYETIDLNKPWSEYNISHELTDKGVVRFAADWNSLIA